FQAAFGDETITVDRIALALAQFVRAIVSYRSPFDTGLAQTGNIGAAFPSFSATENQGKGLFLGPARCATCHLTGGGGGGGGPGGGGPGGGGPLANQAIFQMDDPANNGLDAGPVEADNGIGDVSGNAQDNGVFKSPSLRNTELAGPYMHDGRFDTLDEVVAFYNNGVENHPQLDNRLRGPNGQPRNLNLNGQQRAALVDFLETLTDDDLLVDERFSDPFE
ncbi:MAG: cytochrome c peroxidase, partial [Myxococcota bacterium]